MNKVKYLNSLCNSSLSQIPQQKSKGQLCPALMHQRAGGHRRECGSKQKESAATGKVWTERLPVEPSRLAWAREATLATGSLLSKQHLPVAKKIVILSWQPVADQIGCDHDPQW
jgi:hypothetical protein